MDNPKCEKCGAIFKDTDFCPILITEEEDFDYYNNVEDGYIYMPVDGRIERRKCISKWCTSCRSLYLDNLLLEAHCCSFCVNELPDGCVSLKINVCNICLDPDSGFKICPHCNIWLVSTDYVDNSDTCLACDKIMQDYEIKEPF